MPTERRKNPRLGLAIPTRVQGFLVDGTIWEELTTTYDVSSGGACFPLTHEAELGQVLLLTLALPKRLRQHDLTDTSYRVYTLVRGVRRRGEKPRVGVMFFGKYPPRGFQERPAGRYLLPSDSIVNAPAPQGMRSGETPYGGVPAVAAHEGADDPPPDTLVGGAGSPGPKPDDSGSRYTPPPMTAPSTTPKRRAGVPSAPLPGAPGPEFHPTGEVPQDRRGAPRTDLHVLCETCQGKRATIETRLQ